MQLYGKIINEQKIEYAQQNYKGIANFNTNVDLMLKYGFKPVEDTPMPMFDETYQTTSWKWTTKNDTIIKEWTIKDFRTKEEAEEDYYSHLFLTAADVERGIYKAIGKDFDDIVDMVIQSEATGIDIKALKIELRANNFYRGNPYVDAVGKFLGFTEEQLNKFFETNDYKYLLGAENG